MRTKINLFPEFKHKAQPFDEFDKKIKKKVKTILNYVLEVLADNN